jgi:hypothetical protein
MNKERKAPADPKTKKDAPASSRKNDSVINITNPDILKSISGT